MTKCWCDDVPDSGSAVSRLRAISPDTTVTGLQGIRQRPSRTGPVAQATRGSGTPANRDGRTVRAGRLRAPTQVPCGRESAITSARRLDSLSAARIAARPVAGRTSALGASGRHSTGHDPPARVTPTAERRRPRRASAVELLGRGDQAGTARPLRAGPPGGELAAQHGILDRATLQFVRDQESDGQCVTGAVDVHHRQSTRGGGNTRIPSAVATATPSPPRPQTTVEPPLRRTNCLSIGAGFRWCAEDTNSTSDALEEVPQVLVVRIPNVLQVAGDDGTRPARDRQQVPRPVGQVEHRQPAPAKISPARPGRPSRLRCPRPS